MELDLSPVLNYDGKKIKIDESISLSAADNDNFTVQSPVAIDGFVQNIGGTIELYGKCSATLGFSCDRCTEDFSSLVEFEITEKFRKEDTVSDSEENPDITPLCGTSLDLDEIVYSNLYMNLPSKFLCSDNCKGLCPVCGINLNNGECDCSTETTDPRFDILDSLL